MTDRTAERRVLQMALRDDEDRLAKELLSLLNIQSLATEATRRVEAARVRLAERVRKIEQLDEAEEAARRG